MNYEDRRVSYIDVFGVQVHRDIDGSTRVSGTVRIDLSAYDGSDEGPSASVQIATVSASDDPTIRGAERDLIAAAVQLFGRFAKENTSALEQLLSKTRDEQEPNPYAPKD